MSTIQDKVVIITGASSGIGEAAAKELSAKGARVVLAARREERLQKLQEEIERNGGKAVYKVTDVTSHEQMEELAEYTIQAFGKIDVLINNGGAMPHSFLYQKKIEEWNTMIDVIIKGVLYGIAAVLPSMRERKSGHIITISSVAGHVVGAGTSVYCATNFAVRAITEALRKEESAGGRNIRTTMISPGAVDTTIEAESIARAIAFAIEQPSDIAINEMIIRPTIQDW